MSTKKCSHKPSVALTDRDRRLLEKLNAAGWLTTRQIRDYFFPGKSANAVSKRLRKLAGDNYLAMARTSSTEPSLYRLAGQGKQELLGHAEYGEEVSIPNHLPRKLRHFIAVNDLRLYYEKNTAGTSAQLLYFFSERELGRYFEHPQSISDSTIALLRGYKLIPDALIKIRINRESDTWELTLAIEYDAGTEHAAFFGRTKVKQYAALLANHQDRIEDFKVLTFADRTGRIVSLMKETVKHLPPPNLFYFALLEKLAQGRWAESEIFLDPYDFFTSVRRGSQINIIEKEIDAENLPTHALVTLLATSPRSVSSREEREARITSQNEQGYSHDVEPLYRLE
jgi:DNA-binding Lrp family transcriptional regulator